MKTLGIYLCELLAAYGVDTVFGIPGVHTVELYRGLADSPIRHIGARHEQSLGFMADGYARVSGKPGVCLVISGPGLTNLLTAMGQAYADSVPLLVISGVNALGKAGSGNGYLHELPDQQALASQISAFSHSIRCADELPQVLARAFAVFDGARPRPVHIEIPLDLMTAPAGHLPVPQAPPRLKRGTAAHEALQDAAQRLRRAQRPLLLVGGGACHAADEITRLAEQLDAPVLMTINARGLLPAGHPLALSCSPSLPATRALIEDSDVVLAIGTELGPTDYDMYADGGFCVPGQLIRIDIDPQQLFRNRAADLPLAGDSAACASTLSALLAGHQGSTHGAQRAAQTRAAFWQTLDAQSHADLHLLLRIRDALPEARWVGDSTRLVYAGNLGFDAPAPHHWFNASAGFGALGYGLPAAIGAALAEPAQTVICLVGDGGLQFTLAELGSAIQSDVRLVLLLLNNACYGEIKSAMQAAEITPLGVDLPSPDFVALAHAYGWQAERSDDEEVIVHAVLAAAKRSQPTLIELTSRMA
ncbi:5-guanidino-2-oxopentanoate decarboxylase [Craterilacuibacter sinensis]|uniref:5-guanidino-2-oxopentanoate decarboxylase n=1 Tax=Craterilacuibacter sinensis TaxID=2686017 RepID=A0A845BR26_9NEIS|nr:5-guanidino-2-oxopentanoate decarboxylase [Craterilacuibacter sinensis]MXR37618.1 5-guanidino-2-oxopentanoate decarboxylase [Craterilacuibacter sinensis]